MVSLQGKNDKQNSMFQYVNLDELVPEGYFLRLIDRAVDFSFIHQLVAPLIPRIGADPRLTLK